MINTIHIRSHQEDQCLSRLCDPSMTKMRFMVLTDFNQYTKISLVEMQHFGPREECFVSMTGAQLYGVNDNVDQAFLV